MPAKSPLRILSDLISEAVSRIDEQYAAAGLEFPSLDDPLDPADPSCLLLSKPDIVQHTNIIVAATEQLCVSIRAPSLLILIDCHTYLKPACLRAVLSTGVVEILREAGPQGLHVKEISKRNNVDPTKLVRILRLLATYHIFKEVTPNVFANNRVSAAYDTGKASLDVLPIEGEQQVDKYVGTNGSAAFAESETDHHMKATAHIADYLIDPKVSHSEEATDSPFNLSYGVKESFFVWLTKHGNEYKRNRFAVGMRGIEKEYDFPILRGFPWETLPTGASIVDVGGGIGAQALPVLKKFPSFKVYIQDLIIENTKEFWEENIPGCVTSGQVVIQRHDFFMEQPVKGADIFLVRGVAHNWSNKYAIKILSQLREAAVPGKTRLLIVDNIIHYSCRGTDPTAKDIPGSEFQTAPEPLLANFGRASELDYMIDVLMMSIQLGQERTLEDHVHITKESGWKIVRVYSPIGTHFQHIVAEAV